MHLLCYRGDVIDIFDICVYIYFFRVAFFVTETEQNDIYMLYILCVFDMYFISLFYVL